MHGSSLNSSISRRVALTGLLALAASRQAARAWSPADGVRSLIVPFSAGSLADIAARKYADLFGKSGASPFVVENFPGAGGVIATQQLMKRPRDGKTLLWGTSGIVCVAPLLSKAPLEFDPRIDFVPVCTLTRTPFVLFAAKDFPASNLGDLQRMMSGAKEPISYAAADTGSANHVAGEVLLEKLGLKGLHIAHRQNQQAYLDVAQGRVSLGIFGWQNVSTLVESGRVKVLSVLSDTPLGAQPSLPTVQSQGFGNFEIEGWSGLFVAKGATDAVVAEQERQAQWALN